MLLLQMQLPTRIVAVSGTLAYVSQQAWIFHGNVRENILFEKSTITEGNINFESVKYFCVWYTLLQRLMSWVMIVAKWAL